MAVKRLGEKNCHHEGVGGGGGERLVKFEVRGCEAVGTYSLRGKGRQRRLVLLDHLIYL